MLFAVLTGIQIRLGLFVGSLEARPEPSVRFIEAVPDRFRAVRVGLGLDYDGSVDVAAARIIQDVAAVHIDGQGARVGCFFAVLVPGACNVTDTGIDGRGSFGFGFGFCLGCCG